MDVTIVRPKKTVPELLGMIAGGFVGLFVKVWLLMLLLGSLTDWGVSYWQAMAGVLIIAFSLPTSSGGYKIWTKEAK